MPRAEGPVARLGWRLAGEWLGLDTPGPNRKAAEATLVQLRALGRVESVDEALTVGFVMLAEAVDADPTNAALWGQYRAAELSLRGLGADGESDALDRLVAELSAPVRDAEVGEPRDARRAGGKDRGGAGSAVHAVAKPRRGRGGGAAS